MSAREQLLEPSSWARTQRIVIAGTYGSGVAWRLLLALRPGSAQQCAAGGPVQVIDASGEDGLLELAQAGRDAAASVLVIDASRPDSIIRGADETAVLGAPRLVVAVDGMDSVGYASEAFEDARKAFLSATKDLAPSELVFVPVASRSNELIAERNGKAPWYQGPTLLEALVAPLAPS